MPPFNTEMFADIPVLKRKWQAAHCVRDGLVRTYDVGAADVVALGGPLVSAKLRRLVAVLLII